MTLTVEIEHARSGEWIAEIPELPGCMVVEPTEAGALVKVEVLAFRILADRLEHGEARPEDLGSIVLTRTAA